MAGIGNFQVIDPVTNMSTNSVYVDSLNADLKPVCPPFGGFQPFLFKQTCSVADAKNGPRRFCCREELRSGIQLL